MKNKLILTITFLLTAGAVFAQNKVNTVVFVHGAFADGSSWSKVIPILKKNGINSVAVQNPLTSLGDDVAAADRAINIQQGNVILVGHSWGGTVITEAGKNDKVAGLVYVAAFAPDKNQSTSESPKAFKPAPGNAKLKTDKFGYAWLTEENLMTNFAPDLKKEDQIVMTATQGPIATKAFDEKVTTASWMTKPSWYVVAENDKMIDPNYQRAMAKKINAPATSLKTSHVPMLANPQEVAKVIMAAVKSVNETKPMTTKEAQEE